MVKKALLSLLFTCVIVSAQAIVPPIIGGIDTVDVTGMVKDAGSNQPVAGALVVARIGYNWLPYDTLLQPLAGDVVIGGYGVDSALTKNDGSFELRIFIFNDIYYPLAAAPIPALGTLSYVVTKDGYQPASDSGITARRTVNLGTISLEPLSIRTIARTASLLQKAPVTTAAFSLNGRLFQNQTISRGAIQPAAVWSSVQSQNKILSR